MAGGERGCWLPGHDSLLHDILLLQGPQQAMALLQHAALVPAGRPQDHDSCLASWQHPISRHRYYWWAPLLPACPAPTHASCTWRQPPGSCKPRPQPAAVPHT